MAYDRLVTYARDERLALCDLLDEVGPAAPTLCTGWSTLDLACHLVLRERRPDAAIGMIGPLSGYTAGVQRRMAERTPFRRLVQMIRNGPPRMSLFGLPGMDERANTVEFFVHHEDVRRARPGWEPREISDGLSDLLWQRLRLSRFVLRKVPVGVELVRAAPPGTGEAAGSGEPAGPGTPSPGAVRITVRARAPIVTVTGPPAELTMWVLGRTSAARVRLDGSDAAIQALTSVRWRL
jgi:uncharacterized protein (TIGR03085 family)